MKTTRPILYSTLAFFFSLFQVLSFGIEFEKDIRPIIAEFCLTCHSAEKHKGDLNLEQAASPEGIKRHAKVWQAVLEQMMDGEMPPKEEPQPSAEQKTRVTAWVRAALDAIALQRAGDPGPVVMRRLSNAEYTYTVRDLTGVDSLDPVREFPVDGAAGEGFMNTGQALVMSPSLLTKYLDAAKEIARHAVLLPDGIRFSPMTTRRDWTEESLAEIRHFYSTYTAAGGEETVTQQGIALDKNKGGSLPLERYLTASLQWREGGKDLLSVASAHGLSVKYLELLAKLMTSESPSVLLKGLRNSWRRAKPEDVSAMAKEIAKWQNTLWKFCSVGHIGKVSGPKAWMEPVTPLATQQELRKKLTAPATGDEIVFYLSAGDAGDGRDGDIVVWKQPRLILPGRQPFLLSDLRPFLANVRAEHQLISPAADRADICVKAPSMIEIRLPAALATGGEFVTTAALDLVDGAEGSVQVEVLDNKPDAKSGLQLSGITVANINGLWSSNNQSVSFATPIIVNPGSAVQKRWEQSFEEFRQMFPAALCYTKIVPVDEVVTLTLFHREDEHLLRLLLDDTQKAQIDRMWDKLHFVSMDALTLVDAFEQLWQFATQDADPAAFTPMREPIRQRAAAFQQRLVDSEPKHVDAVLHFAEQAWRRPLTNRERQDLRALYQRLRDQELPHEETIRLLIARILVTPAFLYRGEQPKPGAEQAPVNDWELASRLSYFLWSSQPDAELRAVAAAGRLHEPEILMAQTRRMLRDARTSRLATEFGCSWLHIHGFDQLDEKSERHFPTFKDLRGDMYEETRYFLTDLLQNNGSVLDLLDADYTFLNESLARHYGITGVSGQEWRRVDSLKRYGRGGLLGHATTLAKQSGASRTSPILRGNWVAEALLGDRLPRPPKDVPLLPEDEATDALTVRQLTEKHSSDPRCATCHVRIDAFGFALESFDAIGRFRERDLADRPVNTIARVQDGTEINGLSGLRAYLLGPRRDAFLHQFCRKLLGYSLGRSVQLSDEPLLKDLKNRLAANEYWIHTAIEWIVLSPQFREIRGLDVPFDE